MKKRLTCYCATFLLATTVSAADKPVETRINKVGVGGSLSFNYDRPIFKGINSTTGYSLVPRLNLYPATDDEKTDSARNQFKGPLKFMLRPRFNFFNHGYDASDSDFLRGMDDRDASFNIGLKFTTRTPIGGIVLEGGYDVTNKHDGFEGSLLYTNRIPIGSSRFGFYPEVGVYYWSKNVSDYYFGVNQDEALVSGDINRQAYDLEETTSYFLGYRMDYSLTKHWGLAHSLRSTWYDDDILDSPVVDDDADNDLKASFSITYDF